MTEIARLRIQLEDVVPAVVRRIEVPLSIRLSDLHRVIQAAMGWEDQHLHEFRLGRGKLAKTAIVADLVTRLTRSQSFHYVYDFRDDWLHAVTVEAIGPAEPEAVYPRLLEAHGACPPEDCGGAPGYAHLLEAIAAPGHEDHADMVEWAGPEFDPALVDEAAIRKALGKLAKRTKAR